MKAPDLSDADRVMEQIAAILPDADSKSVSLLLTATAIRAINAGISDERAVCGLIASLKTVREHGAKRREH